MVQPHRKWKKKTRFIRQAQKSSSKSTQQNSYIPRDHFRGIAVKYLRSSYSDYGPKERLNLNHEAVAS